MSDIYLKSSTEAELITALTDAGLVIDGHPQAITIHDDGTVTDLYVIGVMYTADGIEIPGFHANMRTDNQQIISATEHLTCEVLSPSFVFA